MLLTLMLVVTTLPMSIVLADDATEIVASELLAGAGTDSSPYIIASAADLKKAAEMVNSGDAIYIAASYKLTADVDYMNYEWTPIGLSGFSGKFSGNGHVVKNIKITTNNNLNGFFGDVSGGAVISNLGLENMTMDLRDGYWTGGFACRNYGTFENCYIANSTLKNTGGWAMGAFVGASANAGTYRNCYVYNVALNGKTEVSNFAGTVEGYSYFYTCYTAGVTSTNATTVYNLTNNPKAKPVTVNQCYSDVATTGTNAPVDATVNPLATAFVK